MSDVGFTFDQLQQRMAPNTPVGGTPPSSAPSTSITKPLSWDDLQARKGDDTQRPPPLPEPKAPGFDEVQQQAAVDRKNHYLAGLQRVTPDYEKHGEPLGKAVFDENNPKDMYYKDPKGNMQKAGDNHIILQDPGDKEFKIFERKPETTTSTGMGGITAAAEALGQGFATNAPTKGAVGPISRLAGSTGVTVNVPKVSVADSPVAGAAGHVLGRLPIAGTPLRDAAAEMGSQIEKAAGVAETIPTGTRVLAEDAGAGVSKAIDQYIDTNPQVGTLSGKTKQLYDKVDSLVNPAFTTDAAGAGRMQNTMNTVTRIGNKYDAADWDKYQSAISEVLGPLTKPGGLNFDTLKFVIRNVGELLSNPSKLPAGVHVSELKQIYGSLKDDMRTLLNVADRTGQGEAVKAWDQATRWTAAASKRRETLVGLLGESSDEGILGKILKLAGTTSSADAKTLATVKRSLPAEEWAQVQGAVTERLGWANKRELGGTFDAEKFVKDYNNISPRARDVIFGATTDSKLRVALDSIAQISSSWKNTKQLVGATGHAGTFGEYGAILGAWELSRELLHSGDWKPFVVALGAALGGRGVSKLLSMPASAEQVARWGKAMSDVRDFPEARTLAAYNNASHALALEAQKQFNVNPDQVEPHLRGAIPQKLQDKINGR